MKSLSMRQPAVSFPGGNHHRRHHPLWFLPDPVGEASPIPMQGLRENLLLEQRDNLPSTATPAEEF